MEHPGFFERAGPFALGIVAEAVSAKPAEGTATIAELNEPEPRFPVGARVRLTAEADRMMHPEQRIGSLEGATGTVLKNDGPVSQEAIDYLEEVAFHPSGTGLTVGDEVEGSG